MTLAPPEPIHDSAEVVGSGDVLPNENGRDGHDQPVTTEPPSEDAPRRVQVPLVVAAAALSTTGAAWVVGGMFQNALLARVTAIVGVVVGATVVGLSYRRSRSAIAQYAALPLAAIAGAALVAPDATGGTANLLGLVGDALLGGGLLQPPVPLDPGWRFLLVVLFAIVVAAALTNAVRLGRPKLAVLVPAPLLIGGAVLQPQGSEVTASTVAIFLLVASFALAYGAEMASDGAVGSRYELRRLARGGGLLVVLMGLMLGMTQLGFLFPDTEDERELPPQRPPKAPLEKDRELFRVRSDKAGPWRVGTLDVYDRTAWLLPPVDAKRLRGIDDDGDIPRALEATDAGTYTAEFDIVDVRGHSLPVPANTVKLVDADDEPKFDPRTGVPRLSERIPRSFQYSIEALALPTSAELNASPEPAAEVMETFGEMPSPPPEILALLADAPTAKFDRLQFVRDRLYANVVAAGAGQPDDVPPARVVQMLQPDAEATPYEITAAEAMLARWAGVPARIGYGFHGGDPLDGGVTSFRPKHGAAWLEAYFEDFGWIPLVGTPPRAKSSLDEDTKNDDPRVLPSDELAMVLYLPAQRTTFKLLYEIVRYWVLVTLPFVILGLLALAVFPWVVKTMRSAKRRRWARPRGPIGQILVSYAELRDRCNDLNVGDVGHTPLLFVDTFVDDPEHEELGWLVTRALWGDLRRDIREDDAVACEQMCRSVGRRIASQQTPVNQMLAAISRASLRDPYSDQVPNLWFSWSPIAGLERRVRMIRRFRPIAALRSPRLAAAVTVLTLIATLSACAPRQAGLEGASTAVKLPRSLVPEDGILGYQFVREADVEGRYRAKSSTNLLVNDGRVFTIRHGSVVEGALQVALFRPDVDSQDRDIQREVERSIAPTFHTYQFGTIRLRVNESAQQRTFLWFPPDSNTMEVFVLRKEFADGLRVVRAVVAHQRGLDAEELAGTFRLPVPETPQAPPPPPPPEAFPVVNP